MNGSGDHAGETVEAVETRPLLVVMERSECLELLAHDELMRPQTTMQTLAALERKVSVTADQDLGAIRICETGYLEVGHKNKLGRDYPPQGTEIIPYSGKK